MGMARLWIAALALPFISAGPLAAGCATETGPAHLVVHVLDGETLLLDSGQEVRLIGALPPQPHLSDNAEAPSPTVAAARRALEQLARERRVTLRFAGPREDRYGRLLAQVFVAGPQGDVWVQQEMIAAGHARAYALPGSGACFSDLARAEETARRSGAGFWGDRRFELRKATETRSLLARSGGFEIVEGVVTGTARTKEMTYLNFGDRWRTDFTASIATSAVDKGKAADRIRELAGRRVRVRGWIERRNGPMIVLSHPDEIEVVDEGGKIPPQAEDASIIEERN